MQPKVSVCIVTYNQVNYIRECLESIVNQQTDFLFEVIVGDDASIDGTTDIVLAYQEKYPSVVKAIIHENNIGPTKNYFSVHNAAQGDYIAHLDGDDYAMPDKIQKQADFLDKFKECSFVGHRVLVIDENGKEQNKLLPNGQWPSITDIEGLVRNYLFFVHSSKMYRKSADQAINHQGSNEFIDFYLHIEHASIGKIGFLSEILGAYRAHCAGVTSSTGKKRYKLIELTIDGFERARQLGVKDDIVEYGKSKFLLSAAFHCLSNGDENGYKQYMNASASKGIFSSHFHRMLYLMQNHVKILQELYKIRKFLISFTEKIILRVKTRDQNAS